MRLDGIAWPKCKKFEFLGLVSEEDCMINEDVTDRIQTEWLKSEVRLECYVIEGCPLK